MASFDFERVGRELLLALRGKRSQVGWSRRLGYRSNVAYAWESGRRWPTAAETLRAAERTHIDVRAAMVTFYGRTPGWLSGTDPATPAGVAALLEDLRGSTPLTDLSMKSGISRYSLSRWMSGQTQPRLPDFLRVIETASLRMVDLLAALIDPTTLPSIAPLWARLEARRQGAGEHPWTQAILQALGLAAYRALPEHRPGWIAARLGIRIEEEHRCLRFLDKTGQIAWDGRHYQIEALPVDTGRRPEINQRLKAHWARVGAERIEKGADGQFSYNVFNVSRADFERIRQEHLRYYRALRAIVAESAPDEIVAVANVQLFTLEESDAE
ncbi:MAG: DUF4423 domain-containing protein [Myxococcota bacterium]